MRIHNIYVDDAGETHWRDIEVEWVQERNGSKLSDRLPATGIIFRETSGDYDLDWHPAPRRQYIVNLDGGVKITASDGEAREIGAKAIDEELGNAHGLTRHSSEGWNLSRVAQPQFRPCRPRSQPSLG